MTGEPGTPGPAPRLPARPSDAHKGDFGTVAVIGGCARAETRMIGAPALAARAALRAGAGRAWIVAPAPVVDAAVALCPSATGRALEVNPDGGITPHRAAEVLDQVVRGCDSIVVGPGLGRAGAKGGGEDAIVLRCARQEDVPIVIDADALHALAAIPEFWLDFRARAVLTPHPGEYRSLAGSLGLAPAGTSDDERRSAAESLARRLGCVVVLKGARTVVTDGHETSVLAGEDPVLATAGTGDVLAGIIGALAGAHSRQTLRDLAWAGVTVHARAGARWREARGADAGMLASELADEVPGAMAGLARED